MKGYTHTVWEITLLISAVSRLIASKSTTEAYIKKSTVSGTIIKKNKNIK